MLPIKSDLNQFMKNGHQEMLLKEKLCKKTISKMVHLMFCLLCFCHAAFQRMSKSTVKPPEVFKREAATVDDLHLNMDSKEQMLL